MKNLKAIIIAAIVLVIDQISKHVINTYMGLGDTIPLIKNVLHITLVHNIGAGFGILQGQRWFFIIFSLIVLGVLIRKWNKITKEVVIPLGLILGGLIGNLIDRVILIHVIDFIDFRIWPVFNVADSCITIWVVWLIVMLWKK